MNVILDYFDMKSIYDSSFIDYDLIYDFMKYLRRRNNSNSSLKKKLGIIVRAIHYNDLKIDLSKVKVGSIKQKPFRIFNNQELKIIINYYMNLDLSNPIYFTKYIAVMLLIHTGIRRSELCRIKINHIDFDNHIIYLDETKTGNDRIIFFRSYLKNDLKKYIQLKKRHYLLWNFRHDKIFTPTNVSDFIKYDKRAMGLKYFSAHMFRHTFATNLIENGGELTTVQQILGHQSIKTTEIYLHLSNKYIKNDYDLHSINIKK
jgi:integrase